MLPLWSSRVAADTVQIFHINLDARCHTPTDYATWWQDASERGDAATYTVTWAPVYEPYYFGVTSAIPRYEIKFQQVSDDGLLLLLT